MMKNSFTKNQDFHDDMMLNVDLQHSDDEGEIRDSELEEEVEGKKKKAKKNNR